MILSERETPLQTPYNFNTNETCTWFEFTTANGIRYEVTFMSNTGLLYNYPAFAPFVYEMSILAASGQAPFDFRVQLTISTIVRRFFEDYKHVLLFVCDSMDGRHAQRRIKFDRWYEELAHKDLIEKHDGYFCEEGIEIFSTIILRTDFELKTEILNASFEINDPN